VGVSLAVPFAANDVGWFVALVLSAALVCGVLTLWQGERFLHWFVKWFWWI
jgi:hypothetical protein